MGQFNKKKKLLLLFWKHLSLKCLFKTTYLNSIFFKKLLLKKYMQINDIYRIHLINVMQF